MSKYELYVYGHNISTAGFRGGGELFKATIIAKDRKDQVRLYNNYKRRIARNNSRKRTPRVIYTAVEYKEQS